MQLIDFDAIVKNANVFKKILGESRLCAVLKNDAYGHGIVRTAGALSGVADYFAVGSIEEALAVERFCPNILILLPVTSAEKIATAIEHNFALTVDSFFVAEAVRRAVPSGKKARIHIKINTGMNRLGFNSQELCRLFSSDFSKFNAEGIFSHFWGETRQACNAQLADFNKACEFASGFFHRHLLRHIANTSGTLLGEEYHLDMARVGLGIYGYCGEPEVECDSTADFYAVRKLLTPAKTVTAKVIAVRDVYAGDTVGYGGTHTFAKDTCIAVINAGYANGFPHATGNFHVKLGGRLCPVVGNVCMAMLMADIGSAAVAVGDDAILLGRDLNNANSQVIVYELLCNLK